MFAKILALGAFAGYVAAQSNSLFFTSVPTSFQAGQQATFEYHADDTTSPVTIVLRNGSDPNNLGTVSTITTTNTGGPDVKYTWLVPSDLYPANTYALEIMQGSQVNYQGPFTITGGSTSTGGSSSSSVASSAPATTVPPMTSANITSATASSNATTLLLNTTSISSTPPFMTQNNTSTLPPNTQTTGTAKPTSTKPTATGSSSAVPSTGAAAAMERSSNLALVLGGVAAMVYFG